MQLLAMAMARWVLAVPVPPTRTALRCWAIKPPPARSLTSVWLMGVLSNWKSSRSFKRQLGDGELVLDRASLLLVDLGVEQVADNALGFVLALDGGRHDLVEGSLHAVEFEFAHEIEQLSALH